MGAARTSPSLAVRAVAESDRPVAARLARELHLPLLGAEAPASAAAAYDALLLQSARGLALERTGRGTPGPVQVDFASARMRQRRRGGGSELLGRAVGIGARRSLEVLDATAGLGRDSFVLADLGCRMLVCERDPIVAALLSSGLAAAATAQEEYVVRAAARMRLWAADARSLPARDLLAIDVICLDPMFPPRSKRAAVKKEMALFQALLGDPPPGDAEDLLHWALAQDVARVVVKRPPRAAALAGVAPSHCIGGRTVRYDVHVRRALAHH